MFTQPVCIHMYMYMYERDYPSISISNHYLYACMYVCMYRDRVAPAAVTFKLRRLYAARSEGNGPRGEGAWFTPTIYMYVSMNRGLDKRLYKGMHRGQVAPATVADNHCRLHAARREANGPRGEGAWLTNLSICM